MMEEAKKYKSTEYFPNKGNVNSLRVGLFERRIERKGKSDIEYIRRVNMDFSSFTEGEMAIFQNWNEKSKLFIKTNMEMVNVLKWKNIYHL